MVVTSMGLRLRLTLILTVPLVLVLGVFGFVRVPAERAELLAQELRTMAFASKVIRVALEDVLQEETTAQLDERVADLIEQQDQVDRIRLFDRGLRPVLVSGAVAIGADVPTDVIGRVMASGTPEGFPRAVNGRLGLYYVAPLRWPDGSLWGAVEIAHLPTNVEERFRAATRDVWLGLLIVLVSVALLSAVVLQRQVLRPLARMMDGIRRLGEGESGPALPVGRRDELGQLAEAFNQMTERLQVARLALLSEAERALGLERQLRQAETLTVAGKLASRVAHEVGTPLNIVSGRAEMLLDSLAPDDPRRDELTRIIAQIDRIAGIIRSLLEIVRPRKPEVRPTALSEVVDQVLPLIAATARRRGIALSASVPTWLPSVLADPGQVQQVLLNLLMNALDATADGGRIDVVAEALTADNRPGVAVHVRDTGAGIPPDALSKIFEPFFTTKPRGEGTGLGLPICRDIVNEHGGDIRVDSRVGAGTTVTVWLPMAARES
jgi:two-component system, NtrC family, sensor kinase